MKYTKEATFLNSVFEDWLSKEIAIGRIQAPPGWRDPILRAAWLNANWIKCAQVIDPAKEIKVFTDESFEKFVKSFTSHLAASLGRIQD